MSDNILNITNGDSAVKVMRDANIVGEYLPWRDILHEGPVPTGVTQQDLNKARALFIARQGWGKREPTFDWLTYRDSIASLANTYDEVVLWFEHDLYDQLQLLQILTFLESQNLARIPVNLICVTDYLGLMQPAQLAALQAQKQTVTTRHYQLASLVWQAFTNFDPIQLYNLLIKDLAPFEFLKPALYRLFQQYPSAENGLNRTERQILHAINAGKQYPHEIFHANQLADVVKFMGDTTFWYYLSSLSSGSMPLVNTQQGEKFALPEKFASPSDFNQQQLYTTDAGKAVLADNIDWLDLYDIDRWYGGVHIFADNIWRWNDETRSLCR